MTNPFENTQWVRNMIATGVITPPRDEMGNGDRRIQIIVFGFIGLLGLFFWLGMVRL
jgi:hypothetical protein